MLPSNCGTTKHETAVSSKFGSEPSETYITPDYLSSIYAKPVYTSSRKYSDQKAERAGTATATTPDKRPDPVTRTPPTFLRQVRIGPTSSAGTSTPVKAHASRGDNELSEAKTKANCPIPSKAAAMYYSSLLRNGKPPLKQEKEAKPEERPARMVHSASTGKHMKGSYSVDNKGNRGSAEADGNKRELKSDTTPRNNRPGTTCILLVYSFMG